MRISPFFLAIMLPCLALAQSQPNIVFLFADDAGYADFGFQGSEVMKTPNLDRLAAESVRFTQAYVSDPTCGPSRAGLITGRYQQRFGFEENNVPGFMSDVSAADGAEMGLPLAELTMGDYLQTLGYETAYFGKWHLGGADRFHPTNRGFGTFYGFRGGARSYFEYTEEPVDHLNLMERNFGDFEEPEGYLTDVLADEASNFINQNQDKPFFAFVAFNAVHTPMDAIPADLEHFDNLQGNRKTVAAMTLALDRACGKILQTLDDLDLAGNTIVVFTNDNGGPTDRNASSNFPLSGTKSNHLEGGIRVPFLLRWKERIPHRSIYTNPISTLDLLPTFLESAGYNIDTLDHLDGVNLIPYITGQKKGLPHNSLYWKKDCRAVVRTGDWKLLRFPDRPAELYNIKQDERELRNLAALHPDRVKSMFKMIFAWESSLERPRWLLKRRFENVDIERMDAYRDQSKFFVEERSR